MKPLGALGVADRLPDTAGWTPTSPEVLHLLPMINRTSVAIYSPLACAYLAPAISNSSNVRRISFDTSSAVDCTSYVPQQWYLKNLITGAVQFFTSKFFDKLYWYFGGGHFLFISKPQVYFGSSYFPAEFSSILTFCNNLAISSWCLIAICQGLKTILHILHKDPEDLRKNTSPLVHSLECYVNYNCLDRQTRCP